MKQEVIVVDPTWKVLYRAGGMSFIVSGMLLIVGVVLLLVIGPLPSASEALLKSLAGQQLLVHSIIGVFALSAILRIPAVLGVYVALGEDRKAPVSNPLLLLVVSPISI